MIKVIKYLRVFQTWPFAGQHYIQPDLSSLLYSKDKVHSSAQRLSFSQLAAWYKLSLVHIEYLYIRWLWSRWSLISKVTLWSSVGGAAALGLAWDAVTWDILSPRVVLLFYSGKGLCFISDYLSPTELPPPPHTQNTHFVYIAIYCDTRGVTI